MGSGHGYVATGHHLAAMGSGPGLIASGPNMAAMIGE